MFWSAMMLSVFALHFCTGEQSGEVASMLQLRRMAQKLAKGKRQPEEGEEGEETLTEEGQEDDEFTPEYEIQQGVVCGGRTIQTIAGIDGTMTDNIDMATAACNTNPTCLALNYRETDGSSQWQLKDSDEIDYSSEESVTDEDDEDGESQSACLIKPTALVEVQSEAAASLAEGKRFKQPDDDGEDGDEDDEEDEGDSPEYEIQQGVVCGGRTIQTIAGIDGTMTDNIDMATAACNTNPTCLALNYRETDGSSQWQLKDSDEIDYSSEESVTDEDDEDGESQSACLIKPTALIDTTPPKKHNQQAASLAEGKRFKQPDDDDEDGDEDDEEEEYSENQGVLCGGNTLRNIDQTDGTMTDNIDMVTALCNADPRCKSVNYRSGDAWQLKDSAELDESSDDSATYEDENEEAEYVCLVKPSAEDEEEELPEE